MAITLFKHNQDAYESALLMLEEYGKAAIIHPTGTGKSFIGFKLCEDHPDKTVCWLSPSEYIFQTQMENLAEASAGYQPENIRFITYAKLLLMSPEEIAKIRPDYIVLDEFHRCGARMWNLGVQNMLAAYPEVPVLGMSATAIRYLDNQRNMADELFEGNIASEMTLGEALVRGILNPPTYVLSVFSYQQDYDRLKAKVRHAKNQAVRDQADKYLEALRRAMEMADGLDVIFDKHMQDRTGKYIVFCANVEHMNEMIERVPEWFGKIDAHPHIYSVYADDPTVSKAFADFKKDRSAHLKLLFCIDMLNEGVHVEDVSGVILFRPTVSPIIYKQQIGRALSASKAKEPVIFDIVNNVENLYSISSIEQEMQMAASYYRFRGMEEEIICDHFTVIDEVRDAKQLFDQLNDTLTASWDLMYAHAEAYYQKHGELLVPKRYKTADGYNLGNWIAIQRKVYAGEQYGVLGTDRIEKLNAIGMVWESVRDLSWKKYYEAAKAYYDEHGDLNITADYKTESGLKLGAWISRIRTYRKSGIQQIYLNKERITALEQIGMVWDIPDYVWEENFAACTQYYRTYGHLNIPAQYISPDGYRLGTWIRRQRKLREGKIDRPGITEEQIARLDQIGMTWNSRKESSWKNGYKEAKAYYETNNDLNVPAAYVSASGFRLGSWIANHRKRGRQNHSEEQRQQLDAIGMIWEKPDSWEKRFTLAKSYYDEHGDLNIPADYKPDGIWLFKWLSEQRQIYHGNRAGKSLTDEQVSRLESIEMHWENKNRQTWSRAWQEQYEAAKQYFEAHGHLNIPAEYRTQNDKRLDLWIARQRKLKKENKLSHEQIEQLNAIGMIWELEDAWEKGFSHAEQYFKERGNLRVPNTYICTDGYKLGNWIVNQRNSYSNPDKYRRVTEVQKARLDSILMIWNVNDARWNESYAVAKRYFAEHQHLNVPKAERTYAGMDLYGWLGEQRRKYRAGAMNPERVAKLEAIGMEWKNTGHTKMEMPISV